MKIYWLILISKPRDEEKQAEEQEILNIYWTTIESILNALKSNQNAII